MGEREQSVAHGQGGRQEAASSPGRTCGGASAPDRISLLPPAPDVTCTVARGST